MGLFWKSVNARMKRDGIAPRDDQHREELYRKYRDELFVERHGLTFDEWKKKTAKSQERTA